MEKIIGQRLKEERNKASLTQAALAMLSGVSQAAISQIENSRRDDPGVYLVAHLEQALKLLPGSLIRRVGD